MPQQKLQKFQKILQSRTQTNIFTRNRHNSSIEDFPTVRVNQVNIGNSELAAGSCQKSFPLKTNTCVHDDIEISYSWRHINSKPVTRWFYTKSPRREGSGIISLLYGLWEYELWSRNRLEFESNFENLNSGMLLNDERFKRDIRLFGYLLEFRYHNHGLSGVEKFWRKVMLRDLILPVSGPLADKIWSIFLKLGFEYDEILNQIFEYADSIFKNHGTRWKRLYDYVLEHFLVTGDGRKALKWHKRLLPNHPPGAKRFRNFFREVLHQKGDASSLKAIYVDSPYRNVYRCVIPYFIQRGQFQKAMEWHLFLVKNHDLPSDPKLFEPLLRHLSRYYKSQSMLVAKSLQESKVLMSLPPLNNPEDHKKISGELMNRIHGKTFGISVKEYNDELGARWFATSWVSLDTAINTISALGVKEIGPLSLQAIALRDPLVDSVTHRIDQLCKQNISLGNSLFAKALVYFARNQYVEFLKGLLHDDQHPDQLDDFNLQTKLLLESARIQDWPRFYRILEIQSLNSINPNIYKKNTLLTINLANENLKIARQVLRQMIVEKIPIKSSTISCILSRTLQPRRRSSAPCNRTSDLYFSIQTLLDIMNSGSYIPVYHWREIIKRLGMLGRLSQLESLCLNLVRWYLPDLTHKGEKPPNYRILSDMPVKNPLHPTRTLFDNNFQRAVIAWGFIHPLKKSYEDNSSITNSENLISNNSELPDITFGITLLNKLHRHGVFVDGNIVSRAILNRLVTYFGPPIVSWKIYNRKGHMLLRGRFIEVVQQIDNALGQNIFNNMNLHGYLHDMAERKIYKLNRKLMKSKVNTTRS